MAANETFLNETFLGNGVFAAFDGHRIVLYLRGPGNTVLRDQGKITDAIALEPYVFQALMEFAWRSSVFRNRIKASNSERKNNERHD